MSQMSNLDVEKQEFLAEKAAKYLYTGTNCHRFAHGQRYTLEALRETKHGIDVRLTTDLDKSEWCNCFFFANNFEMSQDRRNMLHLLNDAARKGETPLYNYHLGL